MNRFFAVVLVFSLMAFPVFAEDICRLGEKAHSMTSAQIADFSSSSIAGRFFDGSGYVKDVRTGRGVSKYSVVVDCGNDVLVYVPTNSDKAAGDLKVGANVSFSGKAENIAKRHYQNASRAYVSVVLADGASLR